MGPLDAWITACKGPGRENLPPGPSLILVLVLGNASGLLAGYMLDFHALFTCTGLQASGSWGWGEGGLFQVTDATSPFKVMERAQE